MSPDISVEVRLHLELPSEIHSASIEALLACAKKVGATVLDMETVYVFEGSEDIPEYLIEKSQFLDYATGLTSRPWLGKNWLVALEISNNVGRVKADHEGIEFGDAKATIDLRNILEYYEAG